MPDRIKKIDPILNANAFHDNLRLAQGRRPGVDKDEKLLLTLTRGAETDPWGFSLVGARDILEQVLNKQNKVINWERDRDRVK